MPEGAVVAATKLRPPQLRAGLVRRHALVRLVSTSPFARLTLVSAPAGWGKTTLVSLWQDAPDEHRPFAWLALDTEDNDPVRFWDGAIATIAQVVPGFGARAQAALRAPGTGLTTVVLPLMINELAEREKPLVLVLDDLHVVGDPEIHHAVGFLVDRAPPSLHVAVTTRTDPPLPLARLRARGQLVEVRADDLRFSDAEATAMLAGLGVELPAPELRQVQARTEGWAAGLQLAALSLRGRAGVIDRLAVLRAGGPHIAEYLTEEVLGRLDGETRAFLERTCILETLSGDLCDHVIETSGSGERLQALATGGLFVSPVDAAGTWYRTHTLLRELLGRRLQPAQAARLHARASIWHARDGAPGDAIRHAFAAGDGSAANLVAEHWQAFFNRGELATVSGWLSQLPEDDERLWLARVWVALDRGRLDQVDALLRAAPAEETGWAPLLRAVHAFKRGDLPAAVACVASARASGGEASAFWRAVAAVVSGATAYWLGRDAHRWLEDALKTARDDGNRLAEMYALGYLSLASAEEGDRGAAVEHLLAAEALLTADPDLGEHFVALTVHLARAAEDQRRGARDATRTAAERALELARRGAGAIEVAETLRVVALARLRLNRVVDARRGLHEARAVAAGCPEPGRLAERLLAAGARLVDEDREVPEPLSDRELAVLQLLPTQLSQREIGSALYVSVNTVKTHVKNIFAKLRVGSREEAVGRARELGLI